MASPRDRYKAWHPDYFSDSEQRKTTELDRSILEYQLATLTGRSQEAAFETFARKLCEREVCPNLLPTTGPTGGGDSKADAETFPVADQLAFNWFSGDARQAASERWAFAFSAKKDWSPKVKSDIAKIVKTKRGYTKAFFVTNQAVPARKRSESEDKLKVEHGIDVRILDINWILERLFAGKHEDIAIEELKVTGLSRTSPQIGPMDASRLLRMNEAEGRISEGLRSGNWGFALVDDALEVANISRSLEKPRTEVEGSYSRADRFALERGLGRQQVESAYQWAWTLFWWFEDIPGALKQYQIVESRAKESENVYDVERLSNLWMILRTAALENHDDDMLKTVDDMQGTLINSLERLAQDEERPSTSLQAQTIHLKVELQLALQEAKSPGSVLKKLKLIIGKAEGLVGFPMKSLVQIIQQIGTVLSDDSEYDELLSTVIDITSKREGEIRAAKLLLERGEQLLAMNLSAKAIAMIGQALARLYKHETRKDIVTALFACGRAYERVGLFWAARGVYLSGSSIAVNEYWRYGEVTPSLVLCAEALRRIELILGRLPQLLAWHEFYIVIRTTLSNNELNEELEKDDDLFEALLARLLIRSSPGDLSQLERLPDALDRMQLPAAAGSLLFLLGYPERLQEVAGDDDVESLANSVWRLEADIPLPKAPVTYTANTVSMASRILGCLVKVESSTAQPCIEIAESVLAALESLLATSIMARMMAVEPELTIEVEQFPQMEELIQAELTEHLGKLHMLIKCKQFNPYDIPLETQAELRQKIFEIVVTLLSNMVISQNIEADLKKIFDEERAIERASAFTSSIGAVHNVHGKSPKFRLVSWVIPSLITYPPIRLKPWLPSAFEAAQKMEPTTPFSPGEGEPPRGLFDASKIAHHKMEVISPIRLRLWDKAGWNGIMYEVFPHSPKPPTMGLLFENEDVGRQIFDGWLSEIGNVDSKHVLRVTIIQGINKSRPLHYRIMITGNIPPHFEKSSVMTFLGRMMTMEPTQPKNLELFLEAYKTHKQFFLVPAHIKDEVPELDSDRAIKLFELHVRNAWEIGLNDLDSAGVQPDDDVLIPATIQNPPVMKLLEQKQRLRSD